MVVLSVFKLKIKFVGSELGETFKLKIFKLYVIG